MKAIISNKRNQIDKIDRNIIRLLEKRFKIVFGLKKYKEKHNLPMEDLNREEEIIQKYKKSSLPNGFISKFYNLLFGEAKKK